MIDKRILVIDDEPLIAEDLMMILKEEGYQNVDMAIDYDQALKSIESGPPDLALIDINLGGSKDGIDLAFKISGKYHFPFIFVTSYYDDQTRSRVKNCAPAGYILKPFNERELVINVEMVLYKKRDNRPVFSDKLFIKSGQDLVAIDPVEIDYVEAFDNYAKVYTSNDMHIISHTLKSIQEKLVNQGFVRVHKSYLINFQKVTLISEGYAFLGTHKIPIGKAYRHLLLDQISTL